MNNIGKYLRELSIVVLGVAITLFVSYWLTNRNEKRDVALYLNAIKMEMEGNIKILDKAKKYFQADAKYGEYISSHNTLNEDTLEYYFESCGYQLQRNHLNTDAFEMLKSSGAMRLMDKDLLLSIWNAYTVFGNLNDFFDRYYDRKSEHIEKEVILARNGDIGSIRFKRDLKYVKDAPMYNFYAVNYADAILKDWEGWLKLIKEVLSKLEK